MFSTNIIVLGAFSFISVASILVQTGWKFTHKLVPKLPKNKRWSDILISSCQLSVAVFIFYTVNIWFWTDSSEDSSDIWKMSNPVKLLESTASNANEHFSTTANILTFNETLDTFPSEAEEYTEAQKAMRNFNGPELVSNFAGSLGQCVATLRAQGNNVSNQVAMSKRKQDTMEFFTLVPRIKEFMKSGSRYEAPFMAKREQIKQHLESVSESLLNIADKLKKKEQELRREMMETTNQKNRELVFWYILPSIIVFIWTTFSIFTTRFNPNTRSLLVARIILNVLFYIVALHVVVVFVFEVVSSSNKCQPDPQLLDFFEFEVPSFNKSSRTITKEDFLNCTATKSHIFAAPNDEIFIPTTIYDDYMRTIPDTLIPPTKAPLESMYDAFGSVDIHQNKVIDLIPKILEHTTTCKPLRDFKTNLEELLISYRKLAKSLALFGYDQTVSREPDFHNNFIRENGLIFIKKCMSKMQNAIDGSIQKYNDLINDAGFNCYSMSEAFQHGYSRTCFVINGQLIFAAKLVLVGCSVIAIITHTLANKKYEIVLEKTKNQEEENQTNV